MSWRSKAHSGPGLRLPSLCRSICSQAERAAIQPGLHRRGNALPGSMRLLERRDGVRRERERLVVRSGLGDLFRRGEETIKEMTGRSTKMSLRAAEPRPSLSSPFEVVIRAEAEKDVDYKSVYLKVRNLERLDRFPLFMASDDVNTSSDANEDVDIFDTTLQVATEGALRAGEAQEWAVQVVLPSDASPSYSDGKYIAAVWEFEAGIGMGLSGVNPTTGWVELQIAK